MLSQIAMIGVSRLQRAGTASRTRVSSHGSRRGARRDLGHAKRRASERPRALANGEDLVMCEPDDLVEPEVVGAELR
jgi:hypothetical protein